MFQISFYVPENDAEKVKLALFEAGAGKIGNYSHCSFEYRGLGQFLPLTGARPVIGEIGKIEQVPELKVEMVCAPEFVKSAIEALKAAHPYETPAYIVTETLNY